MGNNPSWFIDVAANRPLSLEQIQKAKRIVLEMEKGIPIESSYLAHNHSFAKQVRTIFRNLGLMHILPDVVGMNWFWVQTGSKPYELNNNYLVAPEAELKKGNN